MADKPKKMGRPLKTLECLPENWEEMVIDLGKKGKSKDYIRCKLGISNDLFYKWMGSVNEGGNAHFSETINYAVDLSLLWWENAGQDYLVTEKGINFNQTTWLFNMKNRFGWRDRIEQTNTHSFDDRLKDIADKLPD